MALNAPPIQEVTTDQLGRFPQVWIRWFTEVCDAITRNNFSNVSTVTADLTLGIDNSTILCDASGGVITITLPDVVEFSGFKFYIKKIDVSANDVTIDGNGANVENASTRLLSGSGRPSLETQSDGTEWWII